MPSVTVLLPLDKYRALRDRARERGHAVHLEAGLLLGDALAEESFVAIEKPKAKRAAKK